MINGRISRGEGRCAGTATQAKGSLATCASEGDPLEPTVEHSSCRWQRTGRQPERARLLMALSRIVWHASRTHTRHSERHPTVVAPLFFFASLCRTHVRWREPWALAGPPNIYFLNSVTASDRLEFGCDVDISCSRRRDTQGWEGDLRRLVRRAERRLVVSATTRAGIACRGTPSRRRGEGRPVRSLRRAR